MGGPLSSNIATQIARLISKRADNGLKLLVHVLGDSFYRIGPSIAMVLFQSRRAIDHWATISVVTGWDRAI